MGQMKEGTFRIVIGVDFSEASRQAVLEAIHMSHVLRKADLQFVHVMELPSGVHDARLIDATSEGMPEAMSRLERFVRDELFADYRVRCELAFHVRVGDPAREIHQVAVDVNADAIMVGAPAHARGVRSWLHRSCAASLARDAHVPVVLARPNELENFPKTEAPAPARTGQEAPQSGMSSYTVVDYEVGRSSHISGLI